ncbi:hypothetical protein CRUP_034436 [Coryphaenoides rupestris]|nr:hypothetical protein CRUP_034436 [Coryphaenoides rupestris]
MDVPPPTAAAANAGGDVVKDEFRTADGEVKYGRDAEELIRPERNTLLVSFSDLERFNQELATTIQEEYYRYTCIY